MSGVSSHRVGMDLRYASRTAPAADTSAAQEGTEGAPGSQATSGTPVAGTVERLIQQFSQSGTAPRRLQAGGASSSQARSSLQPHSRPGTQPPSPTLTLQAGTDPMFAPMTSPRSFNDVHFHPSNYVQRGRSADDLINMMNHIGCERSVLMPIPTSFNAMMSSANPGCCGGNSQGCAEYYYVPTAIKDHLASQGNRPITMAEIRGIQGELWVDSGVDGATADLVRAAQPGDRERFDPMITGLHLGDIRNVESLLRKLTQEPGIFTGIGEITIHKEVVEELFAGKGQANLTDRSQAVKGLLDAAGAIGMPVVLHCDVNSLTQQERKTAGQPTYASDTAHFDNLKRLFQDDSVKNTTVIWAHGGGIGRYVDPPDNYPGALDQLLQDCPKLHLDISWDVVARKMAASPEKLRDWSQFLEKHSDRVLFGTDSLAPADRTVWSSTLQEHQSLLNSLTPDARRAIKIENYDRLIAGARDKVRTFEQYVLPQIQDQLNNPTLSSAAPIDAAFIKRYTTSTYRALANIRDESPLASHRIELDSQGQVVEASASTHQRTVEDWNSQQKPQLSERTRQDKALVEQVLTANSRVGTAFAAGGGGSGVAAVHLPMQQEGTHTT